LKNAGPWRSEGMSHGVSPTCARAEIFSRNRLIMRRFDS
jgi:hypothetical protein